jgi:hypothetical protein
MSARASCSSPSTTAEVRAREFGSPSSMIREKEYMSPNLRSLSIDVSAEIAKYNY